MRHGTWLLCVLAACGEATPRCPPGMSVEGDRCVCDAPRFLDLDGDGYGAGERLASCALTPGIVTLEGDCDDTDASRFPDAEELCNGVDDDCDGLIDEDFECPRETELPCSTACGTTGLRFCSSECVIEEAVECLPPEETCNGVDDDCDGLIDEGVRAMIELGEVSDGAQLEAQVRGFPGGMVILARGLTAGSIIALDGDGARLRSDRTLDPRIESPRLGERNGAILLRGVYEGTPPRPFCGKFGPAPTLELESRNCAGELHRDLVLLDVLGTGDDELWVAHVSERLRAGFVGGSSAAAIWPLTHGGAPISATRAFGVDDMKTFVVDSGGKLTVYVEDDSAGAPPHSYVVQADFGIARASAVGRRGSAVTVAQAIAPLILVRRFFSNLTCASGSPLGSCVEAIVPAAVSSSGVSPMAVREIGARIFVAYVEDDGAELGLIELGLDGALVDQLSFGEGGGPFADVFIVDVDDSQPRVLARTVSGALRLYELGCPTG